MKYRLKDHELQKKLDEISKGDFSDALEVCSAAVASALKRGKPTTIWFGVQPQLSLEITSDMLEEVQEYDPHAWNKYPEVEPPKDVWMRCETVRILEDQAESPCTHFAVDFMKQSTNRSSSVGLMIKKASGSLGTF